MIAYLTTTNTILLTVDDHAEAIPLHSPQGRAVLAELKRQEASGRWCAATLLQLLQLDRLVVKYSDNDLTITTDGSVLRKGKKLPEILAKRVLDCFESGVPYTYLLNFFDRMSKNPDPRAIEGLYKFLENMKMPITKDGFFLGYKGIRENWYDIHSGRYLNKPRCVLTMDRSACNADPDQGCSTGLHVGSLEYATQWAGSGGRVVVVQVDPADVVSVPSDCEFQKLRSCKYTVMCEARGPMAGTAVEDPENPYGTEFDGDDDGDDDDDDDDPQHETRFKGLVIKVTSLFRDA